MRLGRGSKFWTDERVGVLTRMWSANAPLNEIAAKLGVTPRAILSQRFVLGLPVRTVGRRTTWTPELDALVLSRRARGVTVREIAAELDMTWASVKNRVHALTHNSTHRERKKVVASPLRPNRRGYFDSAAALDRLLERWAA